MTDDLTPQVTIEDALMRSATDLAFRERLLADPGTALAELGLELPAEGFDVPPLADAEGELADDALEGITGGHMGPPLWQLTRGPSPWDP